MTNQSYKYADFPVKDSKTWPKEPRLGPRHAAGFRHGSYPTFFNILQLLVQDKISHLYVSKHAHSVNFTG